MPDHGGGSREPPRLHLSAGERTTYFRTWATTPGLNRATVTGACALLALAATLNILWVTLLITRLSSSTPPEWAAVGLLAFFAALASWAAAATAARARGTTWTFDRSARAITRTRTSLFGAQTPRTWHDHDIAHIRREDRTRHGTPYTAVTLVLAQGGAVAVGEGLELVQVYQLAADLRWALHRDREPTP